MSIFRKRMPNGKFSPTYYYDFTVDGKRHTGSTGCRTEKEAHKFERDVINKLRQQSSVEGLVGNFRDTLSGGEPIKLENAFKRFVKKPQKASIGKKQLSSKESYWQDFLAYMAEQHPEARRLSDVTKPMAEGYIQHLRTNGRYSKQIRYRPKYAHRETSYQNKHNQLSARTCNVYHGTLQQIFEALFDDASLRSNPFKSIPKMKKAPHKREVFTSDELKLIREKGDDFIRSIFAIGIYTGFREGDICTLKWEEVDLKTGWINRKMRKTGKEVRIPIVPPLRASFEKLRTDSDEESEYVLPEHAQIYLTNPDGISYRVRSFLESIGITTTRKVPGRTRKVSVKDVHSLRHTFCTNAVENGIPINIVQSIVGHVSPEITQMYMDHANDEMKRQKLGSMPNYLDPPEPDPEPESSLEQAAAVLNQMTADNTTDWPRLRDRALKLIRESQESEDAR